MWPKNTPPAPSPRKPYWIFMDDSNPLVGQWGGKKVLWGFNPYCFWKDEWNDLNLSASRRGVFFMGRFQPAIHFRGSIGKAMAIRAFFFSSK
ncbi:MAG: hypothetical protein IJE17_12595 [Clostridia bacterium]|nr:hypothetical protein [Clostridia bacterium]